MLDPESPAAQKIELRRTMAAHRAKFFEHTPEAPSSLRDNFLKAITLPPHSIVAGYNARDSEMNPALLMHALEQQGHRLALPVTVGRNQPLEFRHYQSGDPLQKGPLGILEPTAAAAILDPDVLLVPFLAFDKKGNRLGYGGGYYDRTLRILKNRKNILAIGVGFSCQQVPLVPSNLYDIKVDAIVTELEFLALQKS